QTQPAESRASFRTEPRITTKHCCASRRLSPILERIMMETCLAAQLLALAVVATPVLEFVSPQGGQRGAEIEITVSVKNAADDAKLVFSRSGISATRVDDKK